jgi:hypothetical protein
MIDMAKAERTTISLTRDMHTALSKLSGENGVPIAYIIREGVATYLREKGIEIKDVHPGWGGRRNQEESAAGDE